MKKTLLLALFVIMITALMGLSACVVLNPKVEEVKHTVTFMNGNVKYAEQSVLDGSTATRPATNPTRTDHTFDNWYLELSEDGTGSGSPFNFATAIKADTTLYAAFVAIDKGEAVVIFLSDEHVNDFVLNLYPHVAYEGETFVPTSYNTNRYDFSDYVGLELELYEESLEISEALAYFDISKEADVSTTYSPFAETHYLFDDDTDTSYCLYSHKDYSIFMAIGDDGYVMDWIYGDITVSIVENATGEYIIIDNNGVVETYEVITDESEVGQSVVLNQDFMDTYVYNGVAILHAYERTVKPNYLMTHFHFGASSSFVTSKGEAIDLSFLNKTGVVESITYDAIVASDAQVFGSQYLTDELATALVALEGQATYDNALDDIITEHEAYVVFVSATEEDNILAIVNIIDGEHTYYYSLSISGGKIMVAECNVTMGDNYYIYFFGFDGTEYKTFELIPDKAFNGTLPNEEFEILMFLGRELNVRVTFAAN